MARSSGGVFDMRNVLLEKKSKVVNETKDIEMASLISHMSTNQLEISITLSKGCKEYARS